MNTPQPISAIADQLCAMLREGDVVAFDIFDTLLLRRIHPEHVKRLMARRLTDQLPLAISPEALYGLRAEIERTLCQAAEAAGDDLEFRFDEMAGELYDRLLSSEPDALVECSREAFVALCEATEWDLECAVQRIDPTMRALLDRLTARGHQLICISDFYLGGAMIERLLQHHELRRYFQRVFVSSDTLRTKRSGRLYAQVLDELALAPERLVMLGDNVHSDGEMAQAAGLRALIIDRSDQRARYEHSWRLGNSSAAMLAGLKRAIKQCHTALSAEQRRFGELATTLYLFIATLHRTLSRQGARHVFFLSREGELLKRLFDNYQQQAGLGEQARITSHYLLVSRKSTFMPSLAPLDEESFETLFRQYRAISPADFLGSLGMDRQAISEITAELGLAAEQRVDDFPTSAAFATLIAAPTFRAWYASTRETQRANLHHYLQSFGVPLASEGLHIVDLGWKGSIQDHLAKCLGETVAVHGYYLGLVAPGLDLPHSTKSGLVFNRLSDSPFAAVFGANLAMYEVLLSASHGSAECYLASDDGVSVALNHEPGEIALFEQVIRVVQSGLLQTFEAIGAVWRDAALPLSELVPFVARQHARLVFFPTKAELAFFESLHHWENFGLFQTTRFSAPQPTLLQRASNLARFVVAPRRTLEQNGYVWWVPARLSEMGLAEIRYLYGAYKYVRSFAALAGDSVTRRGSSQGANGSSGLAEQLHQTIADQTRLIDERDAYIRELEQREQALRQTIADQAQLVDERDHYIKQLEQRLTAETPGRTG